MISWHLAWAAAVAVTVFWLVLFLLRRLVREHPGKRAAKRTAPRRADPFAGAWPQNATDGDYTMPGMFLGAPVTEVIPIAEVAGRPPWPIVPRAEELLPLPEPGPPPVVADITRNGAGATVTDYDPAAAFKTALLAAVEPPDKGAADRVYALMGGDS